MLAAQPSPYRQQDRLTVIWPSAWTWPGGA